MEITVLDTKFTAIGIVDEYQSLIWTERYNTSGDFEILTPATYKNLDLLRLDRFLTIRKSQVVMIIEAIHLKTDLENGNSLTVTGRSLESILDRRIVWGQRLYSGTLNNMVSSILRDSFIEPAIGARRVSNFVYVESTSKPMTNTVEDRQFVGENVETVIVDLCALYDIGYKIRLSATNSLVFSLYSGEDRSYDQVVNPCVVFSSKFDNLLTVDFKQTTAGVKNTTLVAGEGEGAARKTVTVGTASGLNRKEMFSDAGSNSSKTDTGVLEELAYNKILKSKGETDLVETKSETIFEGSIDTRSIYIPNEDFFIGDIVHIEDDYGHSGRARITEIIISQDESGPSMYPTFQIINS